MKNDIFFPRKTQDIIRRHLALERNDEVAHHPFYKKNILKYLLHSKFSENLYVEI